MALVDTEKAVQQFSGFSRLPMLRQLGLMAGLAASVALGMWVVSWSQSPDYMPLFGGLSPQDSAEVVQVLEQNGVKYRLEGSVVSVPAESVHEMRLKLASEGVPKSEGGGGFELLDEEQPFGTSSFMEKARYNRALEGELSQSISTLSSVLSARVHLAVPKRTVFTRRGNKASASVLVNLYPGRLLNESQVAGIVYLVASSVPNLLVENVTVVDQKGSLLTNSNGSSQMAASSEQFRFVREVESNYSQRIVELLTPMVGPGRVNAQVSIDMDFTSVERTQEQYDPDSKAIRSEQVQEQDSSGGKGPSGIPGALSNTPPSDDPEEEAAVEGGDQASSSNTTRNATRNYELNRTVSHIRETPGSVSKLSVAVVVDYVDEVGDNGRAERVPLKPKELDDIRALVREAVGFDEQRGDSVSVVNVPFRQDEMLSEAFPEPSFVEQALDNPFWVKAGKTLLAAIGILFLIFGVMRPVLRSLAHTQTNGQPQLPAGAVPAGLPAGLEVAEDQVSLSGQPQLQLPNAARMDNYDQQLTMARSMVKEDPKRVAQVVKGWLDS